MISSRKAALVGLAREELGVCLVPNTLNITKGGIYTVPLTEFTSKGRSLHYSSY